MERRLSLHQKLLNFCPNAYFQPPASVKLVYDCFVYKLSQRATVHADDTRYQGRNRYELQFIHRDPDSEIPDQLMQAFRYISHERSYTADNLHHDVFILYD